MTRKTRNREIDRIKKQIQLNPTDEHNYFHLVELYRERQQYNEAKKTMSCLLSLDPDCQVATEALLYLAEIYFDQGDTQGAWGCWQKAVSVSENPAGDPSLHELRGRILLDQYHTAPVDGRDEVALDRAIESFQQAAALSSDPQFLASTYVRLGLAYHDKSSPDVAVDYLTKALATKSLEAQRAAECYMELGLIELWDGDDPEKAIPLLQRALETSPLLPSSNWLSHGYWSLSWAFVMTGNAKDALETGRKALKAADSTHSDYAAALFYAHNVLGTAYALISGKEDQAIHHYSQAVTLREDPETYLNLGKLYLQKGEFSQALRMFREILCIAPDYSRLGDVYNAVGVCLARMEQHEEALASYARAKEEQATISFKPSEIYNNMGVSYWCLGMYAEAAEVFKTALSLMRPKDREYQRMEWYLRQVQSGRPFPGLK